MKTTKTTEKLGKRLKKARREQNLTQEQLAEKLGISRAHMGHIEQGRKTPSLELLQRLTKVLKIKSSEVMPF